MPPSTKPPAVADVIPLRADGPLAPRKKNAVGLTIGLDDDEPVLIAVGPDGVPKRIPIETDDPEPLKRLDESIAGLLDALASLDHLLE